jgi:hypothetical protein
MHPMSNLRQIVVNVVERLTSSKEEDEEGKAPPGWEGTTKAMKKHGEIDNPWALSWWMKNKGMKSHK